MAIKSSFISRISPDIRYMIFDFLSQEPSVLNFTGNSQKHYMVFQNLITVFPILEDELKDWHSRRPYYRITKTQTLVAPYFDPEILEVKYEESGEQNWEAFQRFCRPGGLAQYVHKLKVTVPPETSIIRRLKASILELRSLTRIEIWLDCTITSMFYDNAAKNFVTKPVEHAKCLKEVLDLWFSFLKIYKAYMLIGTNQKFCTGLNVQLMPLSGQGVLFSKASWSDLSKSRLILMEDIKSHVSVFESRRVKKRLLEASEGLEATPSGVERSEKETVGGI